MPYRLRYKFFVDYLPAGTGLSQPNAADSNVDQTSGAQVKAFQQVAGGQIVAGAGTGGAINGADVTALTNAAAADMAAQMNANLGQLAAFISGGP
jgi:hypothetical protein